MSTQPQNDRATNIILPNEIPVLANRASRILLELLIELHDGDVPEGTSEEVTDDG